MRTYPAEGDSAVFELERGGQLFAAMWLDGIDLTARGAARLASARVMVRFYGDPDRDDRAEAADFDELTGFLAEGRAWLLDDEQGRQPGVTDSKSPALCPRKRPRTGQRNW